MDEHHVGLVARFPPSSDVAPERPADGRTRIILDKVNEHVSGIFGRPLGTWSVKTGVLEEAVKSWRGGIEVVVHTPDHITTVACDEDVLDFGLPDHSVEGQVGLHEASVRLAFDHAEYDVSRNDAEVNPW